MKSVHAGEWAVCVAGLGCSLMMHAPYPRIRHTPSVRSSIRDNYRYAHLSAEQPALADISLKVVFLRSDRPTYFA